MVAPGGRSLHTPPGSRLLRRAPSARRPPSRRPARPLVGRRHRPRPGRGAGARPGRRGRGLESRPFPQVRRPPPRPSRPAGGWISGSLDPVFTGELAAPRAEFEAGRYERTVQLLGEGRGHAPGPLPARARPAEGTSGGRRRRRSWRRSPPSCPPSPTGAGSRPRSPARSSASWTRAGRLFAVVPPTSRVYPDARFGLARVLRRQGELVGGGRDARAARPWRFPAVGTGRGRRGAGHPGRPRPGAAGRRGRAAGAARALEQPPPVSARRPGRATAREVRPHRPGDGRPGRGAGRAAPEPPGARRAAAGAPAAPAPGSAGLPRAPGARAGRCARSGATPRWRRCSRPVVRGCTDPDLRVRALYLLGTSQAVVSPPAAVKTFDGLAREFPENPLADDALFVAADLLAQDGKLAAGAVAAGPHRRALPAGGLSSARRCSRRSGSGTARATRPGRWPPSRRWRRPGARPRRATTSSARGTGGAACSTQQKRTAEALGLWEALALEHPGTYYGLMARERLAERDPARAARVGSQLAPLPVRPSPRRPRLGHAAATIGTSSPGWSSSASASTTPPRPSCSPRAVPGSRPRRSGSWSRRSRAPVTPARRTGSPAWRCAGTSAVRWSRDRATLWSIAYPDAFRDLVVRYTRGSRGRARAAPGADARGERARPAGPVLGRRGGPDPAHAPHRAGRWRRRCKLRRADRRAAPGSGAQHPARGGLPRAPPQDASTATWPCALASYNAGEGAVSRWRAARPDFELDRWVEEIPLSRDAGLREAGAPQLEHLPAARRAPAAGRGEDRRPPRPGRSASDERGRAVGGHPGAAPGAALGRVGAGVRGGPGRAADPPPSSRRRGHPPAPGGAAGPHPRRGSRPASPPTRSGRRWWPSPPRACGRCSTPPGWCCTPTSAGRRSRPRRWPRAEAVARGYSNLELRPGDRRARHAVRPAARAAPGADRGGGRHGGRTTARRPRCWCSPRSPRAARW